MLRPTADLSSFPPGWIPSLSRISTAALAATSPIAIVDYNLLDLSLQLLTLLL